MPAGFQQVGAVGTALALAMLVWLPCLQLLFRPHLDQYIAARGLAPKTRAIARGIHPGALAPAAATLLGVIYLVAYLGATLLSPILLLAAGFLGLGRLIRHHFRKGSRP